MFGKQMVLERGGGCFGKTDMNESITH